MENYAVIVKNVKKTFGFKKSSGSSNLKNLNNTRFLNGKIIALEDISFNASKGEVFGIIGLNGSGKTTLLRTVGGIYLPDSGKVSVNGIIAPLLQIGTGFRNELVAKDNIVMYGMLLGMSKSEIKSKIDTIIDFAELKEFSNMKLMHYSSGMKTRLAFSTALQVNPDILLVDEVLSVGDIAFREKSFNEFISFKKSGKTILFTSHNLKAISDLCDRVLLLHKGKMVAIGEPQEIIKQYQDLAKVHN